MKAYFPKLTKYNRKRIKPYHWFDISTDEIDIIKEKGGFVVGVEEESATPISPVISFGVVGEVAVTTNPVVEKLEDKVITTENKPKPKTTTRKKKASNGDKK